MNFVSACDRGLHTGRSHVYPVSLLWVCSADYRARVEAQGWNLYHKRLVIPPHRVYSLQKGDSEAIRSIRLFTI